MHSLRRVGTVPLNTLPSVAMTAAGGVAKAVGQVGVIGMADQQRMVGGHCTRGCGYARTCSTKFEISIRIGKKLLVRIKEYFTFRETTKCLLVGTSQTFTFLVQFTAMW